MTNLPRFRNGWTNDGKTKKGFWSFRYNGRYVSLTRYGAPAANGSKKNLNLAIEARDKFIAEQSNKEHAEKVRADVESNRVVSVYDVVEAYLSERVGTTCQNWQDNTRRLLEDAPNSFCRMFGKLPALSVDVHHVQQWANRHKWGAGGHRVAVKSLKAAFGYAVERRLIPSNPLSGVKTQKSQVRATIFQGNEFSLLLAAAREKEALFFQAVMECPSRPGEIAAINREHVKTSVGGATYFELPANKWKNGRKSGKVRVIPLTRKWQQWALDRIEETNDGEPLFTTTNGRRWEKSLWGRYFRAARKTSGINDQLDPYSIRHTAITKGIKAGIPIAKLAVMFGTSVAEIEHTYSKYLKEIDDMASLVEML